MQRTTLIALAALTSPAATIAHAQCSPTWSDKFAHPDFNRPAYATIVFDDGTGPALYAAGNFKEAGTTPASLVAKWDGANWQPLGAGPGIAPGNSQYVTQLAVHDDDGPGPHPPALYASGNFTTSIPGARIARWDGSTWTPIPESPLASVMASIDDDGPGPLPPALYIGGTFTTAGGIEASRIVRWDGLTWSPLGSGLTPNGGSFTTDVRAILRHDEDGPGPLAPRLFVGGYFGAAGGQTAYHIAAWDGQNWSPLGGGMTSVVAALIELDEDGPGPDHPVLIAGGWFSLAGGLPALGAARWRNGAWSALGSGPGDVKRMILHDLDGPGPLQTQLVAASGSGVNAWNGSTWTSLGVAAQGASSSGIPGFGLYSLTAFDPDGPGAASPSLVVSGNFRRMDSVVVNHIARLEGTAWAPLKPGLGLTILESYGPATLAVFDEDGPGPTQPSLFAGGTISSAGAASTTGLARFSAGTWSPVGTPFPEGTRVTASLVFDDDGPGPNAPALYIAQSSPSGGSFPIVNVVRWDGAAWSTIGSVNAGATGYTQVSALAAFDEDGPGPEPAQLYAGGGNLVSGSDVARWDGNTWSPVGGPLFGVLALAEFDADGAGPLLPRLYAGTLSHGTNNKGLNRLEGQTWTIAGGGIDGPYQAVRALAVMDDDGPGPILPALYVGGTFWSAGSLTTWHIARFDGASWTSPNGGLDHRLESIEIGAYALLPVDEDGPGPATPILYVGGAFFEAGGSPAPRVARWNPASVSWSTLGPGITGDGDFVFALARLDQGPDSGLYASGRLTRAGSIVTTNIAHYACGSRCYPNCDASTSPPLLNVNDFICFLNSFAAGQPYANCDQSALAPTLNVNDFTCFLNRYAVGCP